MPDTKVSDFSDAGALTGTEIVPLANAGANERTTTQAIADLAGGGGLFGPVLSAVPTSANTGLDTWLNQGSATTGDGATGMWIQQTNTNDAASRYTASVPATPYTRRGLLSLTGEGGDGSNNPGVYIGWTDLTKLHLIGVVNGAGSAGLFYSVTKLTDSVTFSGNDYVVARFTHGPRAWFEVEDDGTTVYFRYSNDGEKFITLHSVAKASGFLGSGGYTHLCFTVRGSSTASPTPTIGNLMSWE